MKARFLMLLVFLLGQVTASAKSMPDCSTHGLDPDALKIVIPRTSSEQLIHALELVGDLDEKYIIHTFHFPVFAPKAVTITFQIVRHNDRNGYLQRALEAIAAIQGVEIQCLPLSPGET